MWRRLFEEAPEAVVVLDRALSVVEATERAHPYAAELRSGGPTADRLRELAAAVPPGGADHTTLVRDGDSLAVTIRGFEDHLLIALVPLDEPAANATAATLQRRLDLAHRLLSLQTEHSPLGVIRWDNQWRITFWSHRCEQIFGWNAADALGRHLEEIGFIHPDDAAVVAAIAADVASGRTPSNVSENRNLTKSGEVIYCRWFNSFVRDEGGVRVLSLVEDVTEAVRANRRAHENAERYRSLFVATPDAVFHLDLDATVVAANGAAERLLDAGTEDLVGRHLSELVADRSLALTTSLVARMREGQGLSASLAIRRRDGRTVDTFVSAAPVRIGGKIVGTFVTLRDMTAFVAAKRSIEESEERFRSLFALSPEPILSLALDGTVTRANAAAARSHLLTVESMLGTPITRYLDASAVAAGTALLTRAARGEASEGELLAVRNDRSTYPIFASFIPIVLSDEIVGVHLIARNITEEKRAQEQLTAYAERIRELYLVSATANDSAERQIAATLEAGCRLFNANGAALYDLEAGTAVATVGEPVNESVARAVTERDDAVFSTGAGGTTIGTPIDVTGGRYGALVFIGARSPSPSGFGEIDRDLVQVMGTLLASAIERGRARARLRHLAYNDPLTSLPNRAWFIERLRDELDVAAARRSRAGVMFLDLDRFRDINDTLGHGLGDALLRTIAERLALTVGTDGVVARTGGDEFIVLVPDDPEPEHLAALAERLIATIDQPIEIDGFEQFVTASIGIAVAPEDGSDAETLVKHADVAMYRAKDRGRNVYQFFTPALNASLRTRLSQERSLRNALERDEFVVHYQPQVELATGRLVGVEALVRWAHPRLGLVPPDQFIPSAELSGLIVPLGDWVLRVASAQIAQWQRTFAPGLRLAVNLSARQFHQQRLAARIREIATEAGLTATSLEVEITESVAMSDAQASAAIMSELGAAGITVAVDDFGTGYSSLSYLRRFPLDSIKIDKSFVADVLVEPDDATIVRTVIGMAHSLGLEVCAEGVETEEQLAFLRAEGCDRVQGYLVSPPVDAERLETLLTARRSERGLVLVDG